MITSQRPLREQVKMAEQNRQWQTRQDGLDRIFQTTGPVPKAGDGEVLVRVKTVSLNYRDTEGEASHPPWASGYGP